MHFNGIFDIGHLKLSPEFKKWFTFDNVGKYYLKHFLYGSLVIAFVSTVTKFMSPSIGGFIHGSVPFTFIYLYIISYYNNGKKGIEDLAYNTIIGSPLWITFVFLCYALSAYGFGFSLGISCLFFAVGGYIYYKYIIEDELKKIDSNPHRNVGKP